MRHLSVTIPRRHGMSAWGWMASQTPDGVPCVYPLSDLRPHQTTGRCCWCKPFERDGVIVHNSTDRREEYERGRQVS